MNVNIKNNARKVLIVFLAIILVFSQLFLIFPSVQTLALSGKTKIIVHYAKDAKSDLKWNMWMWPDKKDGSKFDFTKKDTFGQVCEAQFDGDLNKVGFIVRTDEGEKDTEDDRYIENFKEGVSEIWINGGDTKVYYSLAEAISPSNTVASLDKSGKFTVAKLDELNIISIETNIAIPFTSESNEGITVKVDGVDAKIDNITSDEVVDATTTTAKIELALNVNPGQKLAVSKAGFQDMEVVLGDVMGSASFEKMFYYDGNDLGNTYSNIKTSFRVWVPTATEVKLVTYEKWDAKVGNEAVMSKGEKGTWTVDLVGDQKGIFYTYKVNIGGIWTEAVDPYARSVAANGEKGAVIDLNETNPETWKPKEKPKLENLTDTIIYELHVRDFSNDKSSGMENKGKFLALTETGTVGVDGKKTGIDYIKDLGVTHVQLMPVFDYASVDETSENPQFNWGYDPKNYNAPEGSYSTDPYNPNLRVKELKQAVQALHDKGLRVTMDVVYNHMFSSNDSNFNKLVPGYYFRYTEDGKNANESGCGNTIASENAMARKFIVDSVMYWANEYNFDGFRFDLMGLLDIQTMTEVRKSLSSLNPSILVIGEGFDMGTTLTTDMKAIQKNASKMPGIGYFNDTIRDGIKGSVFEATDKGFVNGKTNTEASIKKGIVGGIDYSSEITTWGKVEPIQSVTYVESHDNNTLWDKLLLTNPKDDDKTRLKMDRLAESIILTSQGIPFFQAGQEFLRTKGGDANSYKSSDAVNNLDWERKSQNVETVDYFKGLIALRKAHPAFRMTSADMIKKNLKFLEVPKNVVAYEMNYNANMDTWANIVVAFNANKEDTTIKLSKKGTWNIVVDGESAGVETIKQFRGDTLVVPALSSIVIHYEATNIFTTLPFWIYTILILVGVSTIILFIMRKKRN
ncbi:type I pullulanase [Clostridium sp.]|uniref:type I pullulanase n=1 Tax=Clostridium sp. TaxID=1506 RepID=UPI001A49BCAE|nr:type I pullulanase [Clostridium sp.]MBK5241494.1 type I pullulanase [Clostridium sp.]